MHESDARTSDGHANPSDAYPPTRPGALVVVVAVLLIAVGLGIENWPDISRQVPRIETAFGL
jgi:sulfite exporter TauE/SafE